MYKPTDKDLTPEGLTHLLKNYHVMATFLGGIVPCKKADGSLITYKVENFFVEGINTVDDLQNAIRSEVFGMPHGIYLEARNIKRAPAVIYNIFNEDEQRQLKEANLPAEAIELMKSSCFEILDQYKDLGDSKEKKPADETEAVPDQAEYDKYFQEYDKMQRNEIADLIVEQGWDVEFKFKAHFSSKAECIRFYILHKHNIKPALTS